MEGSASTTLDGQSTTGTQPSLETQPNEPGNDPLTEAEEELIKNAINGLIGKYGKDVFSEVSEEVTTGNKRKRQYESRSSYHTEAIGRRLKELETSARVSFFLNLNNSQVKYLHEYFMKDFKGSKDLTSWMSNTAYKRITGNFNTWKHRTLENLISHIKDLNRAEPEFKRIKHKSVVAAELEKKFNLEAFALIFDFVRKHIDLRSSSKKVERFCKLLYVELGSYAKMHLNWLDDPKRLEVSNYSRSGFAERVANCTLSKKWERHIPKQEDIKLIQRVEGYRRQKKAKKDRYKKPDDDNDFFVLESDDDESGSDMPTPTT